MDNAAKLNSDTQIIGLKGVKFMREKLYDTMGRRPINFYLLLHKTKKTRT